MLGKRSRPLQKIPSSSAETPHPACEASIVADLAESKACFFNTPKIFIAFSTNTPSDLEGAKSPTSPLDIKTFAGVGSSYWHEKQLRSPKAALDSMQCGSPRPWQKKDSEGIGLGIVAALHCNNETNATADGAVHGSKLKVLVGSNQAIFSPQNQIVSPRSPANLKLPYALPTSLTNARPCSPIKSTQPIRNDSFSHGFAEPSDSDGMEHSESYTCVIKHGPNSSTKHIYTSGGDRETVHFSIQTKHEYEAWDSNPSASKSSRNFFHYPTADFLSACYLCKRHLHPGKDIYMYGGDKAFCSVECRSQQILMDEHNEKLHDSPPPAAHFPTAFHGAKIFATSTTSAA
eukprot:TRINITY_DN3820_c0_g2_i1.p1 TRINITY_DN3820_c0_g2~~TRINITY_DN3820_c0_g2_i1.p1  ORF type:complete len:346 (+),score=56.86 TRINITY_DN3820_c0_g2_i1:1332-2369(+)